MKTYLLFILVLLCGFTAKALDPTVTNPEKYKVILENDKVRVLDYLDKPGEKTIMHHHPAFILYALSDFKRKLTFPDGTSKSREFKAGEIFWMDAQSHIGENIGNTETHVLLVEMKDKEKRD